MGDLSIYEWERYALKKRWFDSDDHEECEVVIRKMIRLDAKYSEYAGEIM
ncbi:MAG: hypothetical protein ACTSW1_08410 [Candidatus Hodarchaeales archaeon]